MIRLFTALYHEAQPFIEEFSMIRDESCRPFQRFISGDGDLSLLVTGTGAVRCAAAVSFDMSKSLSADDLLINIGTAGSSCEPADEGSLFIIDKIMSSEGLRDLYPDMLIDLSGTGIGEAPVISYPRPVENIPEGTLADMESYAFFESASIFTGPHRIMVLKVISDHGDTGSLKGNDLSGLTGRFIPLIRALNGKESLSGSKEEEISFPEGLYMTEYMKNRYRELIRYAKMEGTDVNKLIEDMRCEGLIPASDKRRSAEALSELERRIIS